MPYYLLKIATRVFPEGADNLYALAIRRSCPTSKLLRAILKPIAKLAQEKLGIEARHLDLYGPYKVKLSLEYTEELAHAQTGRRSRTSISMLDGQIIGLFYDSGSSEKSVG